VFIERLNETTATTNIDLFETNFQIVQSLSKFLLKNKDKEVFNKRLSEIGCEKLIDVYLNKLNS